jgi:hypothetical protein
MSIQRIRVVWGGIATGPGVSTFYAEAGAVPDLPKLRTALDNLKTAIAPGVTLQIQNQGDTLDETTGALTGSWSTTASAVITSTATGTFAAPVGGCVNWQTESIHNGRRLRGRTFVVPMASSQFGANGQLLAGAAGALQGLIAGVMLATSPHFVIWGRPVKPKDENGHVIPGSTGSGGLAGVISGGTVPLKAMVLTSRRD